jgi:Fe-S-cluster-containing dehydrogenase component
MKAILVNSEYCTGCHSCEVACKKILGLGEGEYGIKLSETGPWKYETDPLKGKYEWTWTPILTKACDMCEERVENGKMPMCVQHCQAWCMYYGEIEDLAKKMGDGTRWALLTPLTA